MVGPTSTGDWDLLENDVPEADPIFSASPAFNITLAQIFNRDTVSGRGDWRAQ